MKNLKEIIEKYLDGELEGKELEWFENELEVNSELKEEYNLRKEVNEAINEKDVMEIRSQLEVIHKSINKPKSFIRRLYTDNLYRVAAFAIITIVIGSSLIYTQFNSDYSNDKLFNLNYEPYDGIMNVRSGNIETDGVLLTAFRFYESKDYSSALEKFNDVLENDNNNITVVFYTGISYIETGDYENAINSFNVIIENNDNLFVEQADWYLGLCFLKKDEIEKAISKFKKIAESNSFYKNNAAEILDKL